MCKRRERRVFSRYTRNSPGYLPRSIGLLVCRSPHSSIGYAEPETPNRRLHSEQQHCPYEQVLSEPLSPWISERRIMDILQKSPFWERTSTRKRLLGAPWEGVASVSLFLVVRDEAHFHQIRSLNPDSSSRKCLWISDEAHSHSDDSLSTTHPSVDDGHFGAVALWSPDFIHEKRQRGYPPSFLIGRRSRNRRFADVWIGEGQQFSRAEFIIGLKNGFWVIQCLGSSLLLHDDTPLDQYMPDLALDPSKMNPVKWAGLESGFTVEIYCRNPQRSALLTWYHDFPRSPPTLKHALWSIP